MGKITVYEKNKIDRDNDLGTITVTDNIASDNGNDFVKQVRDRSNFTGHATTGSSDAANTQYDIDVIDPFSVDTIVLVNMNFGSYTLQYHNGSSFVDFSTPINVSGNSSDTKFHEFDAVTPTQYRLIVTGTQVADDDKSISQIILTKKVGTFVAEPEIGRFLFDSDKRSNKLISGKRQISRKAESLVVQLGFPPNKTQSDLDLIKDLYQSMEGRLISFVGADDSSVGLTVSGFRNKDLFLMTPDDDYDSSFFEGRFANGLSNQIRLVEAS